MTSERGRDRGRVSEISCVLSHAGDHGRHQNVEHRANDEAGDNAYRHVALRIFCFLRRCRHGIESDEREENDGGAAHDTADAGRNERVPIGRMNHERAEGNDERDYRQFNDDDRVVRARALANSVNQKRGHGCDDQERRKIERDRIAGDGRNCRRGKIRQRFTALSHNRLGGPIIVHCPNWKF